MSKQDYIPQNNATFGAWHDQFKTAVLANAVTFGLVTADTTPITADNTDFHAKLTGQTTAAAASKQATADLNSSRANAEKRARALAGRVKKHPAYTPALGNLLGIIGPEDTTDLSVSKPQLTGFDRHGGVVELDFNLLTSDGVNIYSRRDGDGDFKFLARDTVAPYIDNRPMLVAGKPELREYKAVFVRYDQEVSLFSDEVTINCAPMV
jgi:hypothetical protein